MLIFRSLSKSRSRRLFLIALALASVAGVSSAAAHGGDPAVIHACVQQGSDHVRIVGPSEECRSPEVAVHWGVAGPTGPTGPTGATGAAGPAGPTGPQGESGVVASMAIGVDCGAGDTIAGALAQGLAAKQLTLVVMGICNENVLVARDDVTIQGDLSGVTPSTINGPDATLNTVTVTGARVLIDGVKVTGGLNGITGRGASRLTIQNCRVSNTGRTGVTFSQSANGSVNSCIVEKNARDGIAVEGSAATIINSTISENKRVGVLFTNGASGRIGITDLGGAAGNDITMNGSNGVHIAIGSAAFVGANNIIANGTDAAAILGRFGVNVSNGSADLVGGNVISNNPSSGINVRGGMLLLGDPAFGFPTTVNQVTGNGAVGNTGGIFGFLGSTIDIRDAQVTNNTAFGIAVSTQSTARLTNDTITGNIGDGVRLVFGSALLLATPAGNISSNTGFGLTCTDGESSFTGNTAGIGPNGTGSISATCTGF